MSCIYLVLFGQVKGNLGKFGNIWAKMVLEALLFEKNTANMKKNVVDFFLIFFG